MENTNILLPKNAQQIFIEGPEGRLDCLKLSSLTHETIGIAIVFHPDPKGGGTYTNKIVQIIAKTLCNNGYLCICPNLRGVGLSAGTHDMGIGEVSDARAIYEYLRLDYPELPLVLAGFSFGTSIASQLAEFVEHEKLIMVGMAVTRYKVVIPDINKTIAIHGEEDEVVDPELVKTWARENEIPVIWFPHTGHFFHGKLVVLQNMLNNFKL
ncbi:MAG: alpha/beta fold hydrolase [Proteobacteria bacterium]|jgi:alpha/beta superfamily hydrolase|nr:alpha/beta fold hydrolase [Pseudomonadota bacterium]